MGVVGAHKKAKENTGKVSGDKRGLKGGGSQVQRQPRLRSQLRASLGNFVSLYLKIRSRRELQTSSLGCV